MLPGHAEELPEPVHIGLLDAVVGQLVGVEYTLDALGACALGHLRPQPECLVVTVHDAGESREPDGDDPALVVQGALDDLRLAVREYLGDVDGLERGWLHPSVVQDALDPDEHLLPVDLVPDVVGDHLQLPDSLQLYACASGDGDVQVLADGSDPPLDPSCGPEQGTQPVCDLHDLLGCAHIRSCGNLDERDAQTVQPVEDLVVLGGLDLPGRILLQADGEDGDLPVAHIHGTVRGYEGGPLETGRVGSVHHDLPHEVDLVDDVGAEHLREREGDLHRIRVHIVRGLLIQLHQACGALAALVPVAGVPLELCQRGPVDLAHLACGGSEPPEVGSLTVIAEMAVAGAEQLLGVELLVDLDTAHHLVVFTHRWSSCLKARWRAGRAWRPSPPRRTRSSPGPTSA